LQPDLKPGIFWTWQDEQIEDRELLAASIDDMAEHGFGALLVQPRGCRYSIDDEAFVSAVSAASELAGERGVSLWLHLDPRSMAGPLVQATGEGAEFLIVAGTGDSHRTLPLARRPLDVECPIGADGRFELRLDYPRTRPYHVHSDGAIAFRPLGLERCLAFRRDRQGNLLVGSIRDITESAHLFTNELSGYVEVFGRWRHPAGEEWFILALVAFASNYPDFAGEQVRERLATVAKRYADAGARLAGLWWDEPGYCTGFDRSFRADRGRIPWGDSLARLHQRRTGRDPVDDVPYLLYETGDGLWGERREEYYRTLEAAVFGAQHDLGERARAVLGERLRLGVHQTWHQNGDDVINGCMDWWRGAKVLGAGFADVGDAERVDDPRQMAEVIAMGTIAVSLGRRCERQEAYFNLWGVNYGEDGTVPGPDLLDWWVDLQATLGCNWLAHTYGPTGYFERPPVWGPGYPHHPTWPLMKRATARLSKALELAEGMLPRADLALAYPLGTLFRLGSDLANPLAQGAHLLIDALLRAGYELDVVSPEVLGAEAADRYRGVIWLHPFGASPEDVADLGRRRRAGAQVIAAGLPAVPGAGYAGAREWREHLGVAVPERSWPELRQTESSETVDLAGRRWHYRGLPGWGRPQWRVDGRLSARGDGGDSSYLGLLLGGLAEDASELLALLGLDPAWRVPTGAMATRTDLPDGGTLLRVCPARFGRPFHGILRAGTVEFEVGHGLGLLCLRLDANGEVREAIVPEQLDWRVRTNQGSRRA
jgi:hypothetical protein